ncbi:unnamed protein product, partial [Effrenium voratum]
DASGVDRVYLDPVEDKTLYLRSTNAQKKDVAKELHPRIQAVYEEYLRVHLPILRRHLGVHAKNEPIFKEDVHGAGSSRCFPLFPGYWTDSRHHAFTDNNFLRCLGALERKVRECEIKAASPKLMEKHDVPEDALAQAFHHSKEVHQKSYLAGMRNRCNPLQAELLGFT